MNKADLLAQNKLLKENLDLLSKINANSRSVIFYCAECGNPFILNNDQHERRTDKNKAFYCSAGHRNVFNKI